jgi:hypothetical protein
MAYKIIARVRHRFLARSEAKSDDVRFVDEVMQAIFIWIGNSHGFLTMFDF